MAPIIRTYSDQEECFFRRLVAPEETEPGDTLVTLAWARCAVVSFTERSLHGALSPAGGRAAD